MDIVFVRTRLQALIVLNLIKNNIIKKNFILIKLYYNSTTEDHESVYALYRIIAKKSIFSMNIIQTKWQLPASILLIAIHWISFITRGRLFTANITWHPFLIGLRFCPGIPLFTLDDGSGNITKSGAFFESGIPHGSSLRKRFLRFTFPEGGTAYARRMIRDHYTIFDSKHNIVDRTKIIKLPWNWNELLEAHDIPLIPTCASRIFLGTDWHSNPLTDLSEDKIIHINHIIKNCDLYIKHPREQDDSRFFHAHSVHFSSPAESILNYMSNVRNLTVFHMGSTVALSLSANCNITFVDLAKDDII